jgi:hypothetical protein
MSNTTDVTDILISPASVWYAPIDEAYPDETTVVYGADWGGNWVGLGYTLEPVSMAYTQDTFELEVEQIPNVLKETITKETITIESVLAGLTRQNLALGLNGASTTTAAGIGQRAYDEIKAGGKVDLDIYKWGFEALYKDENNAEFPMRFFIHRGAAVLNGELSFSKSAAAGLPIRIKAYADTTLARGEQMILIQRVTAAATVAP